MTIRLLGLIPLADVRGPEVDQGELLRYFGEMFWFPTALLGEAVRWEPIDANRARGTFEDEGLTVSALFEFGEDGSLRRVSAKRYREVEGEYRLEDWSGDAGDYRPVDGILVPFQVRATWHLASGDLEYVRLELTDLEFDAGLVR